MTDAGSGESLRIMNPGADFGDRTRHRRFQNETPGWIRVPENPVLQSSALIDVARRSRPIDRLFCLRRPNQRFGCPALFAKIFRFTFDPNHLYILHRPGPYKGAFRDRHERRVGMRWTRVAPKTRAQSCGRRSRVVLTPRRWRQVLEKQASWGRRWQESPVTGEITEEPVKTVACGNVG
jgi:hypothetical protein